MFLPKEKEKGNKKMLHIKSVKPLFTNLIVTGDRFEKDMVEGGLIIANKGDLKLWQKVLYKGSAVRDIEVGDMVMVSFDNYAKKKYDKNSLHNDLDDNPTIEYSLKWVTIDDEQGNPQECLLLNDRDVQYVFEGEEIDTPTIQIPKKKLLVN